MAKTVYLLILMSSTASFPKYCPVGRYSAEMARALSDLKFVHTSYWSIINFWFMFVSSLDIIISLLFSKRIYMYFSYHQIHNYYVNALMLVLFDDLAIFKYVQIILFFSKIGGFYRIYNILNKWENSYEKD